MRRSELRKLIRKELNESIGLAMATQTVGVVTGRISTVASSDRDQLVFMVDGNRYYVESIDSTSNGVEVVLSKFK